MAEEEVSYASVAFKTKKRSPPKAKEEEDIVYNEVRVQSKTTEKTADTNAKVEEEPVYSEVSERSKTTEKTADTNVSAGLLPDKRTDSRGRCYQQVAYCLGILCVILLLGFISVCVYISTISNQCEEQLKENQSLLALNLSLTNLINKLSSENENLWRNNETLTVRLENLRQNFTALERNVTNLSEKNKNLESQNIKLSEENQDLTTENQQLEKERMEENELSVIDAFCPKQNQNRQCRACQAGWLTFQSSCYAILNPEDPGQKTWEEAREDCRGKSSDLAVIADQTEKTFFSKNSWSSSGNKGYWIGLRAKKGKWKWVDGRDLTESSWIQQPATNGQCVISLEKEGWKSVRCGDRNKWICKNKALSV